MNLAQKLELHKMWLSSDGHKGGRADLRRANLREANLHKANLIEADLSDANMKEANLSGANLKGAKHNEYTIWPAGFDIARLS